MPVASVRKKPPEENAAYPSEPESAESRLWSLQTQLTGLDFALYGCMTGDGPYGPPACRLHSSGWFTGTTAVPVYPGTASTDTHTHNPGTFILEESTGTAAALGILDLRRVCPRRLADDIPRGRRVPCQRPHPGFPGPTRRGGGGAPAPSTHALTRSSAAAVHGIPSGISSALQTAHRLASCTAPAPSRTARCCRAGSLSRRGRGECPHHHAACASSRKN